MLAALRTAHAWAGLTLSLVLALLGLSGSLLVLKSDYLRLVIPEARAEAPLVPASLGAAVERIEAQVAPEERGYVRFADPALGVHTLGFRSGDGAYADQGGTIIARWEDLQRPEVWLFDLHHHLLMGDAGELLAGVCALGGIVLIGTGLVIWFPAARSFAWRMWPRSPRRRDLLSNHRDLGVVFAGPMLVLILTGASMVFSEEARGLLMFTTMSAPAPEQAPPPQASEGDVDWPRALAAAQDAFPAAALRLVSWPGEAGAPASLRMKQQDEWHPNGRTVVYIDPATSSILGVRDAHALPNGERAFNALYPLHAAAVGGRIYDAVAFLSGLALTALGALGAWSFTLKPRRRRAERREQSATTA